MSDHNALRLAMFTPVPPARSGIAAYSAALVGLLPQEWEVTLYTDGPEGLCGHVPVRRDTEFERDNAERAFDLTIYQIGNNPLHATTLPFVKRHPGLLVLHDVVLHPFRGAAFLGADDMPGYRQVLEDCHPAAGARLAHVIAAGLTGPAVNWNFPLSADLIRASRHTVVHGEMLRRWVAAQLSDTSIGSVALWLPVSHAPPEAVAAWRSRVGAAPGVPLLGTFGYLGAEHRVGLLIDALEGLESSDFRLVVVGDAGAAARARVERATATLRARVAFTDFVDDADYGALLRAVDLGVNLRYPSARAASGPLVQLLASGTPAVIHDLVHLRDVPTPAVLRVPTGSRDEEITALRAVLAEWLSDPELRARSGVAAGTWGASTYTPEAMAASYVEAVRTALARPGRRVESA